jgi:hypothetical protein
LGSGGVDRFDYVRGSLNDLLRGGLAAFSAAPRREAC